MLEMHLSYIWSLWGFYILGGRAAVSVHSVPLPPAICHLVPLNTRFSTVASWNMNFFILGGKNSIGIVFIVLFGGSPFSCLRYFYFFTHLLIGTQLHMWEGLCRSPKFFVQLSEESCGVWTLAWIPSSNSSVKSTATGWTLNSPSGSCKAYLMCSPLLRAHGAVLPDIQCLKTIP